MVGVGGGVVVSHVAVGAGAACQLVVVVHVALTALQICVSERKREANRAVIKVRRLPRAGRVTHLAGLREI